jgi:hypothetical protein
MQVSASPPATTGSMRMAKPANPMPLQSPINMF